MKRFLLPTDNLKRVQRLLVVIGAFLLIAGIFAEHPVGYVCATVPIVASAAIWISMGAPGIPSLPISGSLYYIYYAIPFLRGSVENYSGEEFDRAGFAIGLFLFTATVSWALFSRIPRRHRVSPDDAVTSRQIFPLVCLGFLSGIAFLTIIPVLQEGFENFFGAVRSGMLSIAAVACFLFGYGYGRNVLTGWRFKAALALFLGLVTISMIGLFLVSGATYILGAIIGYVLASKKIPLATLAFFMVAFTILHAGKGDMRAKYWTFGSQGGSASVQAAPILLAEWIAAGVSNLAEGKVEETAAIDRTQLLRQMLIVLHATPDYVPYCDGATYAFLMSTLVPRFIDPDKPSSQSGVNFLSVRYGLQSVEATRSTTLSWGLIPEAFANFGWTGVIGIGFAFGLLTGLVTRWSSGVSPLSLQFLIAVSATLSLLNVEADLAYLLLIILQSVASVIVFTTVLRFFGRARSSPAVSPRARRTVA